MHRSEQIVGEHDFFALFKINTGHAAGDAAEQRIDVDADHRRCLGEGEISLCTAKDGDVIAHLGFGNVGDMNTKFFPMVIPILFL